MDIQVILDAGMRCFPIDEKVTRIGLHPLSPEEEPPEVVIPQRLTILRDQGIFTIILMCGEYGISEIALKSSLVLWDMLTPDFTAPNMAVTEQALEMISQTLGHCAICCRGGLGRSGCVDIAYRVKILGQDRTEAIKTVLEGNRIVCAPFDFSDGQYEFLRGL